MAKIVGIDLGTTYSLIAHMVKGSPEIIRDDNGRTLVPSVVSVDGNQRFVVGEQAREHIIDQAERTVYSVKRFMGKAYEDVESDLAITPFAVSSTSASVVRIELGGKAYSPPEISAVILRQLKAQAEAALGEAVEKAVITVPAYFNDAQRQATRDAGRLAGLDVLRIINEPTAASLAYGLGQRSRGVVAVYDLGGGTFDISILKITLGIFEVLSTCGDTHLGGDDFDRALWEKQAEAIKARTGYDPVTPADQQTLRLEAERVKCVLTDAEEAVFTFRRGDPDIEFTATVTREEYEALIAPIIERTRKACKQAMADAGAKPEHLDEVVLVGGSTRVPAVRRLVEEIFQKKPHSELNPDEVVAMGAAVQADILAGGTQDMLLLDITPLSLGIETFGGVMSAMIPRNTTVPTSASEMFTTFVEGQTNVAIHVLQGERELAGDCRSLARFSLTGIPPQPAGLPRIEVTFMIDADGILHVKAMDQRTGKEQQVDVQPSYGLSDEEIEQMLEDSLANAEEDFEMRQLIEARNEADLTITAARNSLDDHGELLSADERMQIDAALEDLERLRESQNHNALRGAMASFEVIIRPLTERQLNQAFKEALQKDPTDDNQG